MIWVLISILVASVVAFILTLITYRDEAPKAVSASKSGSTAVEGEVLVAPVSGEVKPLSEISDEAFSSGALGEGCAVEPSEGKVYAPCDGEITTFFPTCHAIGIKSNAGAEILIHVGMDTVKLNGKGFTARASQGDRIKKGDVLLEFDMDVIKNEGYSLVTPVIITNTGDYAGVVSTDATRVSSGDELITLL